MMGHFAVDHIQRQHRSCKRIRQRLPGCINKQLKAKLWDYLATGWWYMMIIWSTGDDDSIIIGSFFRAALGTSFYNYKWLRSCSDKIIMWQIKSYQCETDWSHLKVDVKDHLQLALKEQYFQGTFSITIYPYFHSASLILM